MTQSMTPTRTKRHGWCGIFGGLAGALIAGALVSGCLGGLVRPHKAAVSALWMDGSAPLAAADFERLEAVGVRELFVEAGALEAGSLNRRPFPEVPAGAAVTLVVGGAIEPGADPDAAGEALASSLRQLFFDVEARGAVPVGVHFDAPEVSTFEGAGEMLGKVRSELGRETFVSVSVRRGWLGDPELKRLVSKVDFVVPFLYGQRPTEDDASDAWDFTILEQRLKTMEELDVPYMLGIVGLGTATHVTKGGKIRERTTEQALYPFIRERSLELKPGFTLQGANRRSYTLVARRPTTVAGWKLAEGDEVRLVRAATTDLRELLGLVDPESHPHCLGKVFYRLPRPEEAMSLSLDNITNAYAAEPAKPDLKVEVEILRRTARGWMLRFQLVNESGELTELSFLDNNFLQIEAEPNSFASDADPGDFYRFDFLKKKADGSLERTFRGTNVMRLYIPIVAGHQRVASGGVEILRRQPDLRISGEFMLPDGSRAEVGPYAWHDGELVDLGASPADGEGDTDDAGGEG